MGKDYNIRPYILEIPSEYTLRNQFLVLPWEYKYYQKKECIVIIKFRKNECNI